tara:strand:+ start:458 stop:592 length:135 start_codon:yes stop_codon:yes gene_type:complete
MARRIIHVRIEKPKVKRKGVHAKSKTSKNKGSDNYKKPYNRQGK